jgi:hypothetical protein
MRSVKRWPRRLLKNLPLLILLAAVSVGYTGCIWLALPGLAFTAYQYRNQLNSLSSTGGGDRSSNSQPASTKSASSDHSIE